MTSKMTAWFQSMESTFGSKSHLLMKRSGQSGGTQVNSMDQASVTKLPFPLLVATLSGLTAPLHQVSFLITIFFECGLKDMLETGERVEADDGYMNADPQYIKAKSSAWHPDKSNSVRNRIRARHETVNARMKIFNALGNKFQHPLQRHQDVFTAVAVLVQLSIRSGEELFEIHEYNQSLWV